MAIVFKKKSTETTGATATETKPAAVKPATKPAALAKAGALIKKPAQVAETKAVEETGPLLTGKEEAQEAIRKLIPQIKEAKLNVDKATATAKNAKAVYDDLCGALLAQVPDLGISDEEGANVVSDHGVATIGAVGQKRTLTDKEKAIQLLEATKPGLALQVASFGLGDLDKYLQKDEVDSVTKTTSTSRSLSVK